MNLFTWNKLNKSKIKTKAIKKIKPCKNDDKKIIFVLKFKKKFEINICNNNTNNKNN